MSALSFTRRAHRIVAIDDTSASSQTGVDPAILIGLSLSFWRTGGLQAVPNILVQNLEYMATINSSAECVWRMVFLRNQSFVGEADHFEPVQAVEADSDTIARSFYPEGNRHD